MPAEKPRSAIWPVTDWEGLAHAAQSVGKEADPLNQLLLKYRGPLELHLRATFPALHQHVEDILQDFAKDKILREGWLGKANRERGRFRDFLKISLKNFVRDRLRSEGAPLASLDELELDVPAEEAQEDAFDLTWAKAILAETLTRMEQDCKRPGKEQPRRTHIWEIFRLRIAQPVLEGIDPLPYDKLVARLGIISPFDAQNMLATAKRICTRHLTEIIAEYEQSGTAVTAELEELKGFLTKLAGKKKG